MKSVNKTFNGKVYKSDGSWIFYPKSKANSWAKKLRNKGMLVRVVKLSYGDYQVFMANK